MALRLKELVPSKKDGGGIRELLKEHKLRGHGQMCLLDGAERVRIPFEAERIGTVLDQLRRRAPAVVAAIGLRHNSATSVIGGMAIAPLPGRNVTLSPPLVTFESMLGGGYPGLTMGALTMVLVNLTCANLMGVTTFFVQGNRPIAGGTRMAPQGRRVSLLDSGRRCWQH